MKSKTIINSKGFTDPMVISRKLLFVIAVIVGLSLAPAGWADPISDTFNDGSDTAPPIAWQHLDPIGTVLSSNYTHWTYPNSNTYRILADASPDPGNYGPARGGSLAPGNYTNFYVAVDVVNWDATVHQFFGVLARVGTPGPGTTSGYLFGWDSGTPGSPTDGDMDVVRLDDENPTDLDSHRFSGDDSVHLETGHSYRFVFMGAGGVFRGQVYDLAAPSVAIVDYFATDPLYDPGASDHVSGTTGIIVANNASPNYDGLADVTFDNFFASDHDPQLVIDNFDDGNDTSPPPPWVHHDSIAEAGVPAACYPGATYTFPSGGYRIFSPVPCVTDAAGPRAYSLREETTWRDFYLSVDAINWDDTIHQLFGLAARINTPGPGTTGGYLFTWEDGSDPLPNTTGGDLDVLRIQDEGGTEAHQMEHDVPAQDSSLHLTNGNSYRFVYIAKGYNFEARIYQLPDTFNPIKRLLAVDTLEMFPSGTVGLIVADHPTDSPYHACSATFDNFYANIAEPVLSINPNAGALDITWPSLAGLWVLQSTPSLAPPVVWTSITSGITRSGLTNTYTITGPTDNQFYRLIKL